METTIISRKLQLQCKIHNQVSANLWYLGLNKIFKFFFSLCSLRLVKVGSGSITLDNGSEDRTPTGSVAVPDPVSGDFLTPASGIRIMDGVKIRIRDLG
jgi:hypothetical protein